MCPSIPSFNIHLKQASGYLNFWRLARLNSLPSGAQMPHPRGGFDTFFFFSKWKNLQAWLSSHWPNFTPGHGRWTSTRGLPGGRDVESSNWSVHYVVMDCLDLSAKQQILNNSHLAEFFTSLRLFPGFQFSYPATVFTSVYLFCKSIKYIDYWHNKPWIWKRSSQ